MAHLLHRMPYRPRGRFWCFTVNNYQNYNWKFPILQLHPEVQYLICGKEVSSTGTKHIQGYIQYQSRVYLSGVKKLFPKGTHIEKQRAERNEAARDYCKKEERYREEGTFEGTSSTFTSNKGTAATRRAIHKALKKGETLAKVLNSNPEEVRFITDISKFCKGRKVESSVLYIHGPTGTGKTFSLLKVLNHIKSSYFTKSSGSKWFDGYQGEEIIILNEFISCIPITTFLQLTDPEPPHLEVKGSHTPNKSLVQIITTNTPPDEQYTDEKVRRPEQWRAYKRRLTHTLDTTGKSFTEIEDWYTTNIQSCLVSNRQLDQQLRFRDRTPEMESETIDPPESSTDANMQAIQEEEDIAEIQQEEESNQSFILPSTLGAHMYKL